MANPLHLTVRELTDTLVEASDVKCVRCTLTDGAITILPGHAPLLGTLSTGTLSWDDPEGTHSLSVPGGILLVEKTGVVVLSGATGPTKTMQMTSRLAQSVLRTHRSRGSWPRADEET